MDLFERKWNLMRQVHELAKPGSVFDIRFKGRAVVLSLARPRVSETQFRAAAIGLLGLGSLVRGTGNVTPLLSRLFLALEIGPASDGRVDIREFIGALYILEFAQVGPYEYSPGAYQDGIQVKKVLVLLIELFDREGEGRLFREDMFKMFLLLSGNLAWAQTLNLLVHELLANDKHFITNGQIHTLLSKECATYGNIRNLFSSAIQTCLGDEKRLIVIHSRDTKVADQAAALVRSACCRASLGASIWRLLIRTFRAWTNYTKWRVRKRLGREFAIKLYNRKQARIVFAQLRRWRSARQEQYNGFVLSQLWYRRQLMRRSWARFVKVHDFYNLKRSFAVRQHLPTYSKAFQRLEKAWQSVQERRQAGKLHDALWTLRTLNRLCRERELRARILWERRLLGHVIKIWQSNAALAKKERLRHQSGLHNRMTLHGIMLDARREKRESELNLLAAERASKDDERRHRKYTLLSFAGVKEKKQLRLKDESVLRAQRAARRTRIDCEENDIHIAVETRRAELVVVARDDATEAVWEKAAIKQLAADAKKIKRNLSIHAEVELVEHQENLLRKWGGFIDYLPPEEPKISESASSSNSEPEHGSFDSSDDFDQNESKQFSESGNGNGCDDAHTNSLENDVSDQNLVPKRKATLWPLPGRRRTHLGDQEEEEILLLHHHVDMLTHTLQVVHKKDRSIVVKNDKKLTFQRLIDSMVRWQTIEHMVDYAFNNSIKIECELLLRHLQHSASASRIQKFWRGSRRRKEMWQSVAKKRFRQESDAASVLQRFWRNSQGWTKLFSQVSMHMYGRFDPRSQEMYYINALTGNWSYSNPFAKRGPKVQEQLRPRTAWVMLFDEGSEKVFYRNQSTGETCANFPLGFHPCWQCGLDFAERGCIDCRYVQNGEVLVPEYCIPCWVLNGAHLRHEFTPVDNQ